jgi:hypothetical protein
METIATEILVAAPPSRVWQILVDFASHEAWDPFLASIEGTPAVGERLRVRFRQGMTFRPRVTACEAERRLEWLGSLGVRGLFDGRHRFELEAVEGGTRLRHGEQFTGILVPLLRRMLADTARGFDAFNHAIKERAEAWAKSAG